MSENVSGQRSSKARLLDNLISLYLLQGLNYVIPMAVLPYLVRVLGINVYGLVAFSQAFSQYFVILTDYGFNLSATRYIAQNRYDVAKVRAMFWQVMLIKGGLALIGLGILVALTLGIPRFRHDAWFFLWAYIAVVGNVLFPQWFFQGIEKMRYISIFTGIAKLISAGLLFIFVHGPKDGVLAVIFQSSGMLLAGIMGIVGALCQIGLRPELPTWPSLKATLSEGWHLFISNAAISLYTNTNLVLVGLLAGNAQAGYFSAAEKLVRAMTGLISPVSQALFPHITSLASTSREIAMRMISRVLGAMASTTFLISVAVMVLAGPLARICFGTAAGMGSVPVIRWIAFLPFLIGVSNVLGVQTMLPFGLDRQFSSILLFSGLLNVFLGIPLIHFFGACGAGVSVLVTEACVTIAMFVFLRSNGIRALTPRSAT